MEQQLHLAMVEVSGNALLEVLAGRWQVSGIPEGATVHRVGIDPYTDNILIVAEHPSFPAVWAGDVMPRLEGLRRVEVVA